MGQRDIRRLLIIGAMSVIQTAVRRGGAPTGSWLARMLAKKPEDRPPHMIDVLKDLKSLKPLKVLPKLAEHEESQESSD